MEVLKLLLTTYVGALLISGAWYLGYRLTKRRERLEDQLISEHTQLRNTRYPTSELPLQGGVRYEDTVQIIPAPDDRRCPHCEAKRCWVWRDSGHTRGCEWYAEPGNVYVNVEDAIHNPGRHTARVVARDWVDYDYTPLPLDVRRVIAPTAYDRRLPVLVARESEPTPEPSAPKLTLSEAVTTRAG